MHGSRTCSVPRRQSNPRMLNLLQLHSPDWAHSIGSFITTSFTSRIIVAVDGEFAAASVVEIRKSGAAEACELVLHRIRTCPISSDSEVVVEGNLGCANCAQTITIRLARKAGDGQAPFVGDAARVRGNAKGLEVRGSSVCAVILLCKLWKVNLALVWGCGIIGVGGVRSTSAAAYVSTATALVDATRGTDFPSGSLDGRLHAHWRIFFLLDFVSIIMLVLFLLVSRILLPGPAGHLLHITGGVGDGAAGSRGGSGRDHHERGDDEQEGGRGTDSSHVDVAVAVAAEE